MVIGVGSREVKVMKEGRGVKGLVTKRRERVRGIRRV